MNQPQNQNKTADAQSSAGEAGANLSGGLERFCIEDAKEELAELFFQCARYERNSMCWKQALDVFCERVISSEREACVEIGEKNMAMAAWEYVREIRARSNV